jgi:raffinose/stachyose/melibiose transport system substrate-binding protein
MKYPLLFSLAPPESSSSSVSTETLVTILHVNPVPEVLEIWQVAASEYEKAHPAKKVRFEYLDHEEFKATLPILLESSDRPNVFHSWGSGVMLKQIQAGVCQDITDAVAGDFKDSFYPAGVQAFMSQGRSYGLPDGVGPVVFWYNKELCEKAGVDPGETKYWEDFIEAVKKCKAAGITPIAVGGAEKWPLQFYPTLLMMRILGKDGMESAYKGNDGGFAGPMFLRHGGCTNNFVISTPSKKAFRELRLAKQLAFSTTGRRGSISNLASGFWGSVKRTLPTNRGYLIPSSVAFSSRRFRVARVRLTTSLAAFTVGWFQRMRRKRRSNL